MCLGITFGDSSCLSCLSGHAFGFSKPAINLFLAIKAVNVVALGRHITTYVSVCYQFSILDMHHLLVQMELHSTVT